MERIPLQGAVRRALLALALMVALAAALPTIAMAATTVQVNTESDVGGAGCAGVPGDCSIRQAINATADGDTVAIPAGHYTLDPALKAIYVDRNITFKGTGNPVIDGGKAIGVFSIGDNGNTFNVSFPTVTIDGVTVTGGDDHINGGGGIVVYGTLTLTNSTVADNTTEWSGGGIGMPSTEGPAGTVRVENSTISGNNAGGDGGGIYNFTGSLTVVNSTVTGNNAGPGGQFQNAHKGGGIYSDPRFRSSASTSIFNSTIAGNTAATDGSGGNIWAGDSPSGEVAAFPLLAAVGVADPGLRMQNTIVTGGTAADGPNCGGATPTSLGFNATPAGECGNSAGAGDVSGDPKLGALAKNGGGTLTRKLLPGSAAIDAGDPNGCRDDKLAMISPDQRTVPRPVGGRCDIGAVEFAPPKAATSAAGAVTTTSATINGSVSNPHIVAGTAHFEFGTSTAYGTTIGPGSMAAGASNDPRSSGVSGLSPNTTYHYRMVAQNDDDTSFGPDVSFTTGSDPQPGPGPGPGPDPIPPPDTPPAPGPGPTPKRPTIRAARATGGCVRSRFSARLSIHVASTTKLRSVHVTLDGMRVRTTKRKRFSVRINARKLAPGTHVLRVVATDSGGRKTTLRQLFRRCRPPTQPAFTG
jgi:hypothetical protein